MLLSLIAPILAVAAVPEPAPAGYLVRLTLVSDGKVIATPSIPVRNGTPATISGGDAERYTIRVTTAPASGNGQLTLTAEVTVRSIGPGKPVVRRFTTSFRLTAHGRALMEVPAASGPGGGKRFTINMSLRPLPVV